MDNMCEFIKQIEEDPFKQIEGLKVGDFYKLQNHLRECKNCDAMVESIYQKYKHIPGNPDSDWEKIKYN